MAETKTTIKLGILALAASAMMMSFLPQALAQNSSNGPAQGSVLRGIVPCGNTAADRCTLAHFFQLIFRAIQFLMMAAGLFAVFQILRQGFNMLLSLGSEEKVTAAKKGLVNALWGLLLILISYTLTLALLGAFGLLDLKKNLINPLDNPIKFIESNTPEN